MSLDMVEERIGAGAEAPEAEQMAEGPATPNMGGYEQVRTQAAPDMSNSFMHFLGNFAQVARLSTEGNEYVKRLTEAFTDPVANAGLVPTEVIELNQPNSALALVANDKAFVLIFSEAVDMLDPHPIVSYEEYAQKALHQIRPNAAIVEVIVVTPEDYERISVMIPVLRNMISIAAGNADADLATSVLRGTDFTIDDSAQEYEKNMLKLDPHGVPLRHDLCLTVFAAKRQQRMSQNWEHDQYFGQMMDGRQVVGCIGGYVEFIRDTSVPGYRFLPIVHISEIKSVIPSPRLIPMFIVIAMRQWMVNQGWKVPYTRHLMNGRDPMDIGALVPDENSETKRWIVKDPTALEQFFQTMHRAQLVLDVTDGRTRIPGIDRYAGNSPRQAPAVINEYNAFLGGPVLDTNHIPFGIADTQFRGTFKYGSSSFDTANIDFLNQYIKHPTEALSLEKLYEKKARPADTWAELREREPDIRSLYRTTVVTLNVPTFTEMSNRMSNINFGNSNVYQNNLFDLSGYNASAQQWGQLNAGAFGSGYQSMMFNPTTSFYGY